MRALFLFLFTALTFAVPAQAFADPADFATTTPPGHWYTETNGDPVPALYGFGVFDESPQ